DADGEHVSRARALQGVRARELERCVATLHVVAVEGVSHEPVLARDERQRRLKRRALLTVEHVAAPSFHERAVAEQAQVAGAAPPVDRWVRRGIAAYVAHFN